LRRRGNLVALLAAGIMIGIVLAATPAGAHIGTVSHLWNHHIKPLADKRYVNELAQTGDVMTGEVSARYVPHSPNPFWLVAGSFPSRLANNTPTPILEFIDRDAGAPFTTTCPGFGRAASGRLCIYAYNNSNLANVNLSGTSDGPNRLFGFSLDLGATDTTIPGWIIASWAYKVPAPSATLRPAARACTDGIGSCQ
jgi:hypothetical protein